MTAGGPRTAEILRPTLIRGAPVVLVTASAVLTYLLLRHDTRTLLSAAALVLVLLTVRRPATALPMLIPLAFVSAVYAEAAFAVPAIAAALLLSMAFRVAAGSLPIRSAHIWIGVLAAVLLAGRLAPASGIPGQVAQDADLIGVLAGLGLLAVAAATPPRPRTVACLIAVTGAVAAGYVLVAGEHLDGRLEGLGFNPNYLGAVLALPLVASAGLLRHHRNPVWLVPGAVCLFAMAQTQSRAAFIAATMGTAIILLQGRTVRVQASVMLTAVVAVALLPAALGTAEHFATGDRRSAELASNSEVRARAAEFAARVAVEHPVRGIGYGRFSAYAASSPRFGLYMATHNDYLRLAAETGAVALIAFLALLLLGTWGRRSGDLAVLRAVVVTHAVGLVFANLLSNMTASLPFWLSLGCLLAAAPSSGVQGGDQIASLTRKVTTDA
ncbi:O-antigen ligase family protein [Actinomadura scrupuli]|uniref:O-antigen ligase family protein n=1 Tax=Actinomadura scrupuli TaxID=559629 RepID=UPI003D972811